MYVTKPIRFELTKQCKSLIPKIPLLGRNCLHWLKEASNKKQRSKQDQTIDSLMKNEVNRKKNIDIHEIVDPDKKILSSRPAKIVSGKLGKNCMDKEKLPVK